MVDPPPPSATTSASEQLPDGLAERLLSGGV
jgi:hypothetical protein